MITGWRSPGAVARHRGADGYARDDQYTAHATLANIQCRGCGVPIRVLSLGDTCDQCSRWETAQRLILRANRLLGAGR